MRFADDRATFGRHETFALRYGWLTKGFQAALENPKIFESEDAIVLLGVGRNMVNSIKHWLLATKITTNGKDGMVPTDIGRRIFGGDGWDPYLEDEATIWLIHWLLSTNPSIATSWNWFFNSFHKPEFTGAEVQGALLDFATENVKSKYSQSTLKGDAALILRMYTQSRGQARTPIEDALDSPLSLLRLVARLPDSRTFQSRPDNREGLPVGVFAHAVTELFDAKNIDMISIEDLMYGKDGYPSPGSVFRLTENALITKLEKMLQFIPGAYELRETAGIHQLYRTKKIKPTKYLEKHYSSMKR
jgi:hypothetical protein